MTKIIRKTQHGKIFKCDKCAKIHIEFNNLSFNFDNTEFKQFANYFKKLNGPYWEKQNKDTIYRRKIFVPIGHKNVTFLLNNEELQEFKLLLNGHNQKLLNTPVKFNYDLNLN